MQVGLSWVQAHSEHLFGKREPTVKDVEMNPEACDLLKLRCVTFLILYFLPFVWAGGVQRHESLTVDEAER